MTTANNRPVSVSETLDFGRCQTQWKFKYHPEYKLSPLTDGPAVEKGNMGHLALENFYKLLQQGEDYTEAAKLIVDKLQRAAFHKMTLGDAEKSKMFAELALRLQQYFEYYKSDVDDWEILHVEFKIRAVDEELDWNMVGRADLVIRYRRGPFIGQLAVIDHKFLGDFWKQKAYEMAPQAGAYPRGLRFMFPNEKIAHFIVNEIRTRIDAIDKFKRTPVEFSPIKLKNIAKNHNLLSAGVTELSNLSREEVDEVATRTMVKTICEWCRFENLCDAQLQGTDTWLMEETFFKPNEYGYTNDGE